MIQIVKFGWVPLQYWSIIALSLAFTGVSAFGVFPSAQSLNGLAKDDDWFPESMRYPATYLSLSILLTFTASCFFARIGFFVWPFVSLGLLIQNWIWHLEMNNVKKNNSEATLDSMLRGLGETEKGTNAATLFHRVRDCIHVNVIIITIAFILFFVLLLIETFGAESWWRSSARDQQSAEPADLESAAAAPATYNPSTGPNVPSTYTRYPDAPAA